MRDDAIQEDLLADADPSEIRMLTALATRLRTERPIPSARFRDELGRELRQAQNRYDATMPPTQQVLARTAWCSLAGIVLLGLAVAGLVGSGPFAS